MAAPGSGGGSVDSASVGPVEQHTQQVVGVRGGDAPTAGADPIRGGTAARVLVGAAAVVAAVIAVAAGLAMADGDRRGVVLPIAAVAGIAVAVLALTRFAGYVLLMLAIRSCVDLFKLTGPSAGQAGAAEGVGPPTRPPCSPCCSCSPPDSGWPPS